MNMEIIKAAFNMSARMTKCSTCKHFDLNKANIEDDGVYRLCEKYSFDASNSIDVECPFFEQK